jgi:hypothetical protein
MGIQVSKTQVSGGSFFMKPGDTFLYSVEDPRGRAMKHGSGTGPLAGLKDVTINEGDEGKKHLIYEGKVDEIVVRNGKVHYRYHFTRLWTTPDRFRNSGQGVVGPWAWARFGSDSWYQSRYFGTKNESPELLTLSPKNGSEFPANHTRNNSPVHSLAAPKEIPSDDPNLAVNGDFSRLSNKEILQFLNKYAMNASYTGRTSTPEVQESAKTYLSMSKSSLERKYKKREQRILSIFQGSLITVTYRTQNGMPESETMNLQSFLDKGIVLLKDKNTVREYTGLVADRGADYDTIYSQEKDTITEHRKELVGSNGFGEEIIMPNIEITGGNLAFQNPRTDIPFVQVRDPLDTDQIMADTGYAQIQKVLQNNPSIEGWMQVKETDSNGNEVVNTIFYKNVSMGDRMSHENEMMGGKTYVSGMSRGAKQLDVVGSEDTRVGTSNYFSVNESRKELPEKRLETIKTGRIQLLGMLHAYIANNHTIRGTGGVIDMLKGGEDIASRMFLLSEALGAKQRALENSLESREKIFGQTQMEGFTTAQPRMINERINEENEIDRLRTAIEQNEAVSNQIAGASTMTSAQFFGATFAALSFFAISFYSLRK